MMPYSFSDQLKEKSPRLAKVVDAVEVKDVCAECYFFNPLEDRPEKGYRCKVMGSCPAATLHPNVQSMLWKNYLGGSDGTSPV